MIHLLLLIIYLAFISLGLPDSLLGSAWPVMHTDLGVPVSFAGVISMIISFGTIISSLQSDRLTRRFGTARVTAVSVGTTALALFGFSLSHSFAALCAWAVPYGLGAGSVDASLNNYVALHFESRHMSWLHCMWGVGASVGPYIMAYALTGSLGWNAGYRMIGLIQVVLTAVLLMSLPLWRTNAAQPAGEAERRPLSLREVTTIGGVKEVMLMFFCYCAVEQTTGLWASSYLNLHKGIAPDTAAGYASLFFIGITAGRALSGFITMRLNDTQMIRMGQAIILLGVLVLVLPMGETLSLAGLILTGLGCAPIYPSIIHLTPALFGSQRSQAIIGVEMASAYVGTCLMPPLFGVLVSVFGAWLLPFYLAALLALMYVLFKRLLHQTRAVPASC